MTASEPPLTTVHTRDVTDTLEQITDAKGATYTFRFDALHRRTSKSYPIDATGFSRSETFEYDVAGNLSLYKNAAGRYKHLDYADSYDSRNRLRHAAWNASVTSNTAADWSVGQETRTDYDAASRMIKIQTNGGETIVAFGYDDANRKIWEDQTVAGYPKRGVVTPRDDDGNRTKLEMYTNGALNYGAYFDYTNRNQLSHIYWDGNHYTPWFTYTYDASGNLVKREDELAGVNDAINAPSQYYDGLNRPTMWENSRIGNDPYARSWYQYDKVGRETATWRDEQSKHGEHFDYLANGQLKKAYYDALQVQTDSPTGESGKTDYVYTADRLNRQSVTENGVVTNYTVNAMNQITVWGGQNATYDGNFNFKSMGGWGYTYDAESRLTALDTGPTPRARFVYDGLGRCVKRTIGTVTTVINYDEWKPIMEWDSPTHWVAWNLYGPGADEILFRSQGGVYLRYHHDIHGNVTALLSYGGTLVERYTYDAFGRPTILSASNTQLSTSAVGNRFMFQGREYFPELGLYDYRHRFYDPWMGRFLQTDPLRFDAGDMNLFRYCGDDPVDRSDPTGLSDLSYIPSWDTIPRIGADLWREIGRGFDRSQIIVSAHGTPNYIVNSTVSKAAWAAFNGSKQVPIPQDMRLSVAQMVRDIKALKGYTPTKPIKLDICYAGAGKENAQAQQIANGLKTNPVIANTGMVNATDGRGLGTDITFVRLDAKHQNDSPSGQKSAAGGEGVSVSRRTFDAEGSSTLAAAEWLKSWGPGGWLAAERTLNR